MSEYTPSLSAPPLALPKRRTETVMSDAMRQAFETYCARLPEDVRPGALSGDDLGLSWGDFKAGWDAAKADLPDRETLARVLHANDLTTGRASDTFENMNEATRDWYFDQADAVLSLLRGETKP